MASFILLTLSLLSVSFWSLLRLQTRTLGLNEGQIQARFAARGGVEDAILELKNGATWGDTSEMSSQWTYEDGLTYYKSTESSIPLTHFDYPVTISVSVEGNPAIETMTVNSTATVLSKGTLFRSVLLARVVRTLTGEFHIVSMREN